MLPCPWEAGQGSALRSKFIDFAKLKSRGHACHSSLTDRSIDLLVNYRKRLNGDSTPYRSFLIEALWGFACV